MSLYYVILNKWPPISLPITESSTPMALVSLRLFVAVDHSLISVFKPPPDTLYCPRNSNLSLLTTLLLHPHGRRIFESAKQTPQLPRRRRKRQRLPPKLPIANAPAGHTCGLTRLHGADAFA